jgi:hypothetical protein
MVRGNLGFTNLEWVVVVLAEGGVSRFRLTPRRSHERQVVFIYLPPMEWLSSEVNWGLAYSK